MFTSFCPKVHAQSSDVTCVTRQDFNQAYPSEDLTDEQCWKIWRLVFAENSVGCMHPRDGAICFVRKMLYGPIDNLESLESELAVAEEHELVDWMRRFRLERQSRN
jgi:hypothetical protein